MSTWERVWRVDDWFRPVPPGVSVPDGTYRQEQVPASWRPAPQRRDVGPRERLLTVVALVLWSLFVLYVVPEHDWARHAAAGSVGPILLQTVRLYRSRGVGFGWRRRSSG